MDPVKNRLLPLDAQKRITLSVSDFGKQPIKTSRLS